MRTYFASIFIKNFLADFPRFLDFFAVIWMRASICSIPPDFQVFRFIFFNERRHINLRSTIRMAACASSVPLSMINPSENLNEVMTSNLEVSISIPWSSEVWSLCNIKAMVEPGMISVGKDYDDVSLLLHHFLDLDSSLCQQTRGDHANLVSQKVVAMFPPFWEQWLGSFF